MSESAFPDPQENWRGDKGMTLRDYFAAKAMQGWLASFVENSHPKAQGTLNILAEEAYSVADAMLKARGL